MDFFMGSNIADFIVLNKNPLTDIKNINSTNMVVKSGTILNKKLIDKKLKNIRDYNISHSSN